MEIDTIVIAGEGELADRIKEKFSNAGLTASISKSNFANAWIVIEALAEEREARKLILSTAEKQTNGSAILATTSGSGITEMAAAIKDSGKFAGLNFIFNPLQDKFVVQIVKCVGTSEQTIDICKKLVEKIGGTALITEDSPGLVLDRIKAMAINEAAIMYEARLATIEDIDRTTKLCLNWPMGPFEFADTIGLDNVMATLEALLQGGYQLTPSRLLKGMVAMGMLGKKSGKGFYTYK